MTDWGPALVELGFGGEDFGPASNGTYQELAAGWRGTSPLPTQGALTSTLNTLAAEKAATAYIPARAQAYRSATAALKSLDSVPEVTAIGFWIDAIMGLLEQEINAGRIQSTAELSALLSARATVKSNNPKPA